MPKLESVNPILAVHDVETSIAHYMEKLGFTSCWGWEQPPAFGGVRRDGIEIFFCKDCQGSSGTWMSVWVDNVDALYEEFQAHGAEIRQPPINFPWGRARDECRRSRRTSPALQHGDGSAR